ncbi:MAG: sigma-70 family RNA polymerase sigma factor [Actinomycetota bacterium]|nr:sigma-70 family RNA polymerase sigma factor [Actinomycetota bacterium]
MQTDLADRQFREMYQENQRRVLAYFLRRTDATSARDGAAETFLVAWRRIDEVPSGDHTLPWLYGVARRVLSNQRRSRSRSAALGRKLADIDPPEDPSPEVIVLRRAEDREMLDAVARLRPEDQEILRLAVWEELPHSQIADMIGTSAHAIAQRIYRITKQLARDLERPSSRAERQIPRPSSEGGGGS